MKISFSIALSALFLSASSPAQEPVPALTFETPIAASDAFIEATKNGETPALLEIFGDQYKDLIGTAEAERDRELRAKVAAMAVERRRFRFDDENTVTMVIGAEAWPFPIPIVKVGETWQFDTGKGIQEIVNRRVGENELSAMASMRAYFDAQTTYITESRDDSGVRKYAAKFTSAPGKMDGLHWPAVSGDNVPSPAGPEIKDAATPHDGYHFKILTAQGDAAPGGKYDYLINGHLIGGFAMIAWPAEYRKTGVMTFIVNHYGDVYEADLGPETSKLATSVTEYNPDNTWELSED
ncbi:MAG: DUF2950 domain-containing protein [Verrucomicrobiota bacterium]